MRRELARLALLVGVIAFGGVSAVGADQAVKDYIVGPNDVLAVMVVDQPQLTGKYIVRADGTFTFPLLGRVQAGGLSLNAVEDDMRERLAKGYLKDPQLGVSVDQYRSQQIFVMGEVRTPGALQFTGVMTLVEALARAGSVNERAAADAVIVRRTDPATPATAPTMPPLAADVTSVEGATVIRVSLDFLRTGQLAQNVPLQGGDTIFVPKAESVFVSGRVQSPGEYPIRKGMTVREVLALAGGVVERGSTRRIQIIRLINGVKTEGSASLSDLVQAGDNVIVRDRLF